MDDVTVRSVSCRRHEVSWTEVPPEQGFELCLVRSGSFVLRSSHHDVTVDPLTSVMGRPGDLVEVAHPHGGGDRYTLVVVSAQTLAAVAGGSLDVPATVRLGAAVIRAHFLLARALDCGGDPWTVEELAIETLTEAIGQSQPARLRSGLPVEALRRQLVDDTRAVLRADPTVNSVVHLAREVGCSPHHLSRLFKAHTGVSLSRYRLELRVRAALDLLQGGGTTLAEIAARCGFSDHAHLTRSMRSVVGDTPSGLLARTRDHRSGYPVN